MRIDTHDASIGAGRGERGQHRPHYTGRIGDNGEGGQRLEPKCRRWFSRVWPSNAGISSGQETLQQRSLPGIAIDNQQPPKRERLEHANVAGNGKVFAAALVVYAAQPQYVATHLGHEPFLDTHGTEQHTGCPRGRCDVQHVRSCDRAGKTMFHCHSQ